MEDIAGRIAREVGSWEGVTTHEHRFGGREFRLGRREIGHLHGERWADLPFHKGIRDMLVDTGRAQPHHVLPQTGWVSKQIRGDDDVVEVIELFRLSYERAQVAARVSSANRSAETLPPDTTMPTDGASSPAK
jgi:luciferase-like monooxygenase